MKEVYLLSKANLALPQIEMVSKELNKETIYDLVQFNCTCPTEMNFMAIKQTESYTAYHCYSAYFSLFPHELYLSTIVVVKEYKDGDKNFYVVIRATSLKSFNLSFDLDLSYETSGKTITKFTMNGESNDGYMFKKSETYDLAPSGELKIVLTLEDIQIESYSEEEYERKAFLISLPTKLTHDFSGSVEDYRWYRNHSPRQTTSKEERY